MSPDSCQDSINMYQLKTARMFQILCVYVEFIRNPARAVQLVPYIGHTQSYKHSPRKTECDVFFCLILSVSFTNFFVFVGNSCQLQCYCSSAPSTEQLGS